MKIAVIGAGPAGLASIKYSIDEGHECEAYEQSGTLGGTWVYTENIGIDENGVPIHSSMYKGMRTNLPKEVMFFLDYPYPNTQSKSYLNQSEVLQYFQDYAKKFSLEKHIKFYSCVMEVTPIGTSEWKLSVVNVKTKEVHSETYGAVFVCNGHYSNPFVPTIPGQKVFEGCQLHSHNYRTPELYVNKKVVIVGAGSSGTDIASKISQVTDHVYLSCKKGSVVPKDIITKPEIKQFSKTSVEFVDSSIENVDVVIYCTGYLYSYPFLTQSCGVTVKDNWVEPLYKQIVNIKHSTMFFIGLPVLVPVIPLCDIQVRYALASLRRKFLPSKEDMLKELEEYVNTSRLLNIPQRHWHKIGSKNLETYFLELSSSADLRPVPSVLSKIYAIARLRRNLEDHFTIINDNNFVLNSES